MEEKVVIITRNGIQSCKLALEFLRTHSIPYIERNVSKNRLTFDEIKELVIRAGGFEKIISSRSKPYRTFQEILKQKDITLFQLYKHIEENPSLITYPILYSKNKFLAGYNEDQLNVFRLRKDKEKELKQLLQRANDLGL